MEERRGYFAVHSQGLGHATRALALARGLLAEQDDLYFLFLAGSPALDLIVSSGFDALTMPPAPNWPARDGHMEPVWRWYIDYVRYLRVARRFLHQEGEWGHYGFLVSDGELASVMEALRRRVPTILILNSVTHDFARDLPSRALEGFGNRWLARLARRVDLLLVADDPPPWRNARPLGPIVRPFSAPREKLRDDFFFRKRTILVTAGGTSIGAFLVRAAVEAFRDLNLEDTSLVVVSGPKVKVAPAPGVYVYGFVPNLHDMVLAADLVITTAGRGTLHEALAAGTPVIAIPPKGHAEAERNAKPLGYRFEDVYRLRALIPEKLALGRLPPYPVGNQAAVRLILEFLASRGLA